MVPYAIHFTTHIQHVFLLFVCLCFFHICCLWHCPSVSQIKPLAKRGSQHRCTGQLALQKHAAGWCHWGDGSVDLFPRFQGILVFKKFEELVYVGVLGGSRLKTPWQKGFIFWFFHYPNLSSNVWFPCQFQHFSIQIWFCFGKKTKKNKFDQNHTFDQI